MYQYILFVVKSYLVIVFRFSIVPLSNLDTKNIDPFYPCIDLGAFDIKCLLKIYWLHSVSFIFYKIKNI